MRPNALRLALRTSIVYAVTAALWILTSDKLLTGLHLDPETTAVVAILKGWGFVVVTAVLLFLSMRRDLARWAVEVERREVAEAASRATEQRMAAYVEHAPVGVIVVDADGLVVDTNPRARALLELPLAVAGAPQAGPAVAAAPALADLVAPEHRSALAGFLAAADAGAEVELEVAGAGRWLHARGVRVDGARVLAFLDDVTRPKRATEEVARLARLETALGRAYVRVANAEDAAALAADLCRDLVHDGACDVAWVGARGAGLSVVAAAAREPRWADAPRVFATALAVPASTSDGRPRVAADLGQAELGSGVDLAAARAVAAETGLASLACVPLGESAGRSLVLVLHGARAGALTAREIPLLDGFGKSVALALTRLATDALRREAEARLRLSEERLRIVGEAVGEIIWLRTLDASRFLYVSPAFEAIFGRPVADLMARAELWMECMAPDDRARVLAEIAAASPTAPLETQYVIVRPDGERRWLHSRRYPHRDASGTFVAVSGVTSDITARKAAEDELRKLSRAVEQSAGGIAIAGPTGLVEYANPRLARFFGTSVAELHGQVLPVLAPGLLEDGERAALSASIAAGGEWRGEVRRDGKDGATTWGVAVVSPLVDERGQVTHVVLHVEDVSPEKQAALRLRESEDRLRALTDGIPAGLCVVVDERVAYANAHAGSLFGVNAPGDLVGLPMALRVVEEERASVSAQLERAALAGDEPSRAPLELVDRRCLRLDGEGFEAEVGVVPFAVAGRPGALVFLRDIADRRRLEAQLRQAQKMEAIGTLAGGVAHDFNNLLTVIQTSTSLVIDSDGDRDEDRELLQEVLDATSRAASLTRQLLLFSRRQQMQLADLALDEVVTNVSKMLRRVLGEDVQLTTTHPSELPLVHGDVGMLEQVLMNLAVNARDAMPDGGRLELGTDRVVVRPGPDGRLPHPDATAGPCVRLTVSDTGSGIAPDVLPHIFEPFFTTKEIGRGTGLGLATVYGIVRQHQGWIEVESALGVGTTFRIYFPALAVSRSALTTERHARPEVGGHETLLLVEDDDAVRRAASAILARAGYNVLQARSAAAALDLWRAQRDHIELVLTDVVMPDRSGFELARVLRADRSDVPIVFASGYATLSGSAEALRLVEGEDLLRKPYSVEALTRIVRARLDARR